MTLKPVGRPSDDRIPWKLIQFAGLVFYLLAAQAVVTAGVGLQIFLSGGGGADLLLPCLSGILAGCYTLVGYNLRRYRLGARNFAFAFAAISLFAFPVGTGLGLVIVACVVSANRAGVFPQRRRPATASEEEWPLLRFEPELSPERAG